MTRDPSNAEESRGENRAGSPPADTVAEGAAGPGPTAAVTPPAKPAAAPGATPAATAIADEALAQAQAEIAVLKDRELRARAELENYRKRAARELGESLRYANLPIIRDLLPVLDNVERAIQAAEQNADAAGLLEGLKLVRQQLEDVLQRHHCKPIEALHAVFNPHLHHAILQQPSAEFPPNTVLTVTQNGYQLHDRVVRPSQVIVSASQ